MYLILQQDAPDDYVIATGVTTEIRDFVKMAFKEVGIEVGFKGKALTRLAMLSLVIMISFKFLQELK